MNLMVEVVDTKGHCPVHQEGDTFRVVEGYKNTGGGAVTFRICAEERGSWGAEGLGWRGR